MIKKIIILIAFIASIASSYFFWNQVSQPLFHTAPIEQAYTPDSTKPAILIVCLADGFGGAEASTLNLYKMLLAHGYNASILVDAHTGSSRFLEQYGLPYFSCHASKVGRFFRPLFHPILRNCLDLICSNKKIDIIHCNARPEVQDTCKLAKKHHAHVVFTRHVPDALKPQVLQGVSGIAAVKKPIADYLENINTKHNLGIKAIETIPPFFDAEKFIIYKPHENKQEFFKTNFNITIGQVPIICMIANFYKNIAHKNHPLLLQAIAHLVHTKHKSVQVMLVGDGQRRAYLENMVKELNIQDYVHFLGFTDKTPDILYHSNIFVLTSTNEAFGIVYLEASLMKKPVIGADGSGAELIIIDEKTGLLFKNNDVNDLTNKLECLIDHPEFARQLGENAYDHVLKNFAPKVTFARYEKLYEKVLKTDE